MTDTTSNSPDRSSLSYAFALGEVTVACQPALEQLIVLLPQGTATTAAIGVAKRNTKQDYMGDI